LARQFRKLLLQLKPVGQLGWLCRWWILTVCPRGPDPTDERGLCAC